VFPGWWTRSGTGAEHVSRDFAAGQGSFGIYVGAEEAF